MLIVLSDKTLEPAPRRAPREDASDVVLRIFGSNGPLHEQLWAHTLAAVLLINGSGALAANYPIFGAWTVAPDSGREIAHVQRACQAFRRKEGLEVKGAEGRLVVFRGAESAWYDGRGRRICRNLSNKATGKTSFRLVDVCRSDAGHSEQMSYTLKRRNSLQVFITPGDAGSRTYELIGCPT